MVVGPAPRASTPTRGAEERVRVDVGSANGLREEPVEEQPASLGRPAVESEGELIEVVGQVLLADATLKCLQAPALEERGDPMNPWEWDVGGLRRRPGHGDAMSEALRGDVGVALPAVGVDETAGLDDVDDKAVE